jgi:hypothetical protein
MATSYKTLWQEEKRKADQLQDEVVKLRAEVERTAQVVDLAGIARHLRVERFTPQQWRQRDLLPPVDFPKIREPLWYASTIKQKFADPTRRVWYEEAEDPWFDDVRGDVSPAA